MLRTDIIRLINAGDAWVFVGAGASVDAGLPTWRGLSEGVVARLRGQQPSLGEDRILNRLILGRDYPKAFTRMVELTDRPTVISGIRSVLRETRPGALTKFLAQWPVRGYVTTNYEHLIEGALQEAGQWSGWIEVGNTSEEVPKAGGNARRIVWHIHGSLERDDRRFYPIVTDTDYAEFYLSTSGLVQQLKSFLAQQRLIFVGFGFQDPDLLRLLEVVKGFSSPANPVYAFLGDENHTLTQRKRRDLFEQYNVDVVPYTIPPTGSHEHLTNLIRVYSSFILKRSQKYGMPERPCPSYAPETTALLLHNSLVMQHRIVLPDAVIRSLLRAQVLSLLRYADRSLTRIDIMPALAERVRLLRKVAPLEDSNGVDQLISEVLDELAAAELIAGEDEIGLTENGSELLRDQAAYSERMYEQFISSLRERVKKRTDDTNSVGRVSKAAESFLKDCIDQRALGIALVGVFGEEKRDFHIVALLQSLPEYMGQLTRDEALLLTEIIQGLLARPSDEERRYFGFALQARFSLNLLGQDPKLVSTRMEQLAKTLFLIDSNTLISLLARSCIGYDFATFLLHRLQALKAPIATTKLLITEVAEHARWAIDRLGGRSAVSSAMLLVTTGRAGHKTNLFLGGFYAELASEATTTSLFDYLDSAMASPAGHTATDEVCDDRLSALGVPSRNLGEWIGFTPLLWPERDDLQKKITDLRKSNHTYTHERQTQAEAEALIIIEKLRAGIFKGDTEVTNAYFLSNTRVVDRVAHSGVPITMRPAALLQWLSTITTASADELATLTNGILWELSERGLNVVDTTTLQQTFSPLLSASREHLPEELAKLNMLTGVEYGESATKAFAALNDLELPIALHSAFAQQTRLLEEKAKKAVSERQAVEKSRLNEHERLEYLRLKAEKQAKRLKSRRRADSSRKRKKR